MNEGQERLLRCNQVNQMSERDEMKDEEESVG